MLTKNLRIGRAPLLSKHYPASQLLRAHPPPSRLQSISRCRRLYDLPCSSNFLPGRGGLLQLLSIPLSPCCRYHPAGVSYRFSQIAVSHAVFAFTVKARPPEFKPFEATCAFTFVTARRLAHYPCGSFVNGLQNIWFPSCLPFVLQGLWLLPWWD